MEYFVERAPSYREAKQRVRQKYGERARIMVQRTVSVGGFLGLFGREGVEVTGYFVPDNHAPPPQRTLNRTLEEEKQKVLNVARPAGKQVDVVLEEIKKLGDRIDRRTASSPPHEEEHSTLRTLRTLLLQNEFSLSYTEKIIRRARSEFSLEQLEEEGAIQQRVVEWIGASVSLGQIVRSRSTTIVILVGPTGVGKTTTIAKLALLFGIDEHNRKRIADVRILTVDSYRIGAREQIEKYGSLMEIPVGYVESIKDLRRQLTLYDGVDWILIDTIGTSPLNSSMLGEMNELLSACGSQRQTILTVSASTKTADLVEVMRQYEPFGYESMIVTKLDETCVVGNVLSAIQKRPKPLLYFTTGQGVPHDIEEASIEGLLMRLDGFHIDRARLRRQMGGER